MKQFHESGRSLRRSSPALLLAALGLSLGACATTPTSSSDAPEFMFVQSAEDLKVDPARSTFRLVKVTQQTLFFSDRPERIAGHLKMADYLKEWGARAGPDNFGQDPPNAALSVYEPGEAGNRVIVVKITNPVVDGADLVYSYKVLKGTMPANGGATTLFIDKIGIGGGVGLGTRGAGPTTGVGIHGAGVGVRGPGVL